MYKKLPFLILLATCACATNPRIAGAPDPDQMAAHNSCAQIAYHLNQMDGIIVDNAPSDSKNLVKSTAVSAAKTGVSQSGVLGGAGPYAGVGMNLLSGLYNINSKQRTDSAVREAELQYALLAEAYEIKGCQ